VQPAGADGPAPTPANKPHDFKLLVDAEGHLGTSMQDVGLPEMAEAAAAS
jgi:hypothetical protein